MMLLYFSRDNAGSDAIAWLLKFLARNYLRDVYSKGTAYVEKRLRETVEKILKYSESLRQNCTIATKVVELLMNI
ncbi:MAG: hypothetical protein QXS51_06495 [Thermoproteota archaeon]|nr:hypothetical protein [Candidatus Brockarchaeota archaeon]